MIEIVVVAFSIVLLRLPVLIGSGSPESRQGLVRLLPFVLVIFARLIEGGDGRRRPAAVLLGGVFLLMIVAAEWRAIGSATGIPFHQWQTDTITYAIVAAFGFVLFIRDSDKERVRSAMMALCFAPAVYVATNVVLRFGGVKPHGVRPLVPQGNAQMLGYLGVHRPRTFFPLTEGVNSFGIVIGLSLVPAIVLAARSKGRARRWAIAAIVSSGYAILLTDSRAATSAAVGAALLVLLLGRKVTVSRLKGVAFLIPASPVIVFGALSLLATGGIAGGGQNRSLATGSNRLFIWKPILNLLQHPDPSQIFGYGAYGQIASGAAQGYQYLFTDTVLTPGAHSFALQTILDTGYVGLAVVVTLFVLNIRTFADASHRGSVAGSLLLAMTLYLLLIGFTEATPMIYTPEIFMFFILSLAAGTGIATVDVALDASLETPATPRDDALAVRPGSYSPSTS
jgi:hypothetical protein